MLCATFPRARLRAVPRDSDTSEGQRSRSFNILAYPGETVARNRSAYADVLPRPTAGDFSSASPERTSAPVHATAVEVEALFRAYAPGLRAFLRRYVNCPAVAEDIVQDLFLAMWEKRERMQIRGCPRNYLLSAAKRRVFDYLQRERVAAKAGAGLSLPAAGATARSRENEILARVDLQGVFGALSPRAREVVFMHRWCGFTYDEIGTCLNISRRTVETHLARAMSALRRGRLAARGQRSP